MEMISYNNDQISYKFITLNNEVLKRYLIDTIKFTAWDKGAIPTMIEWELSKWLESEMGAWSVENGYQLGYSLTTQIITDEISIVIYAYFKPKRWTEFCLRFLDNKS